MVTVELPLISDDIVEVSWVLDSAEGVSVERMLEVLFRNSEEDSNDEIATTDDTTAEDDIYSDSDVGIDSTDKAVSMNEEEDE